MSIYRRGAKGFTLVEIMIVVAIIALIAAIAIPNLLRMRHNANETAAIGNMRTIVSALESFRAAQVPPTYPANLAALSAANQAPGPAYLNNLLAVDPAVFQGYSIAYNFLTAGTYTLNATPVTVGTTGTRQFYADQSGVITANAAGPAGPGDPPVQ